MSKNKQIKVAINGFGRIGRTAFKFLEKNKNIKIVAINDLTDNATLAHLLKYDSVYGRYDKEVKSDSKNLYINKNKYPVFEEKDPAKLPWKKFGVDVVLECTGIFREYKTATQHIKAGAKKVVISAPAKGDNVATYIIGVNEDKYKGEDVVSMASCTTNCIAPVTKVMQENFGIKRAFLTTIHSYTADQNIVDGPHKDLRRARAAAQNIVPTTTGAAIATTEIYPELKGKFDGIAVRVPTICGSLSDLVFELKIKTDIKKIHTAFKKAEKSKQLKNILRATDEPIVSTDIIGDEHSSIVDLSAMQILQGNFVKIIAWYDNEYAYSKRLSEMVEVMTQK
ncbi:MAG: type I glyceraldehyde-3-phosphate dehydrogenase [Patescibacteria group bacterium]